MPDAVGSETMAAAQPLRGVCFPLDAGGAIAVEQLDDGSVEIRESSRGCGRRWCASHLRNGPRSSR